MAILSNISCFSLYYLKKKYPQINQWNWNVPYGFRNKRYIFFFQIHSYILLSSETALTTISNTALFYFLCNFPPRFRWGIQLVFTLSVLPRGYAKRSTASSGLNALLHLLHRKTSPMVLANSLPLVVKKKKRKKSKKKLSYRLTHCRSH